MKVKLESILKSPDSVSIETRLMTSIQEWSRLLNI